MKNDLNAGICAFFMATTFAIPAFAQSEPHIAGWLSGEDEESLSALAELAKDGDFQAQIFLGQLDRDVVPGGTSTYLLSVNEQTRDGLLRSSISETESINWLLALTDTAKDAFGQLLFAYRVGSSPIENAVALRAAGETSAADYLLWATLVDGSFQALEQIPEDDFGLADNDMMRWLRDALSDQNSILNPSTLLESDNPEQLAGLLVLDRMSSILRISAGQTRTVDQLITILKGQGSTLPTSTDPVALNNLLVDLARTDPRLRLLANFCSDCEADNLDLDCIREALEVIDGYRTLMKLRTLSDNVIPAETFYGSPRALITAENLLRAGLRLSRYAPKSACLRELTEA